METITEYLDEAKRRSGCKSDRKFCALLGMSPTWLLHTRRGTLPTDETMLKIADIAGVDPQKALLDLNIWRSQGKTKALYQTMRKTLERAAVLCAVLAAIQVTPALAKVSNHESAQCILRKIKAMVNLLKFKGYSVNYFY
jgi:hypothetical protein